MKRLFNILFLVFCFSAALSAQTISVNVPSVVAVDEQFSVAYTIEGSGKISDFAISGGQDFELRWGPSTSSSRSTQIINGKRTTTSSITYSYVLVPKKEGKFALPMATAKVDGNKVSSALKMVEVVGSQSARQQSSSSAQSGQNSAAVSSENIYMKLTFDKKSVVVGESLQATLKLYTKVDIAGFGSANFPSFSGFWSQDTSPSGNVTFQRESVNGEIYNTSVLKTYTLIPQQSGDIKIDPAELVCMIRVREQRPTGSIFDAFFQDDYRTVNQRVVAEGRTIHVKPLPSGAPASFGGGVGEFKMNARITRDSLNAHDAASLIISLSGKGNLSLLEAPKVKFPLDFESYDVKTSEKNGTREFEYPFIPRSAGEFEIGPIEYSYYSTSAGAYRTLSAGPLPIVVKKTDLSAGQAVSQLVNLAERKEVRNIGTDIISGGFRKQDWKDGSFFVGSALYWSILLALCGLCLALFFVLKRFSARKADVVGSRNRAATGKARKRLSLAGEYLKRKLYSAFYEELHKALLGFISDKFNMDANDMTKDNIQNQLLTSGALESDVKAFVELIEQCEFARYAQSGGTNIMDDHYKAAVQVISTLDSAIKTSKKVRTKSSAAAVLIALLLVPIGLRAQDVDKDALWQQGYEAYSEGRWSDASHCWSAVDSEGAKSAELQYCLGNAWFKQNEIAQAIICYERALRLDPSHKNARANLEVAQTLVQDKIESVPEFFVVTAVKNVVKSMKSDTWAILSIVFFTLLLACVLVFFLSGKSSFRKVSYFGGIAALLLVIATFLAADYLKRECNKSDEAIIVKTVVAVKSSPSVESSTDLFILHAGTKVEVLDAFGEWCNVEIADGRQGWILVKELEII